MPGEIDMTSPAARLFGFLILLGVLFAGAYAVGAHLGPVTLTHSQQGNAGPMRMGAGGAPGSTVQGLSR
jgi:hypothetical protein